MKALPWILVLIGLIAAGYFFTSDKNNKAELARLGQEVTEMRAALDAAPNSATQSSEPALTEKEKQELIRLRNEVGQLKRDKQQLTRQAQQAEANSERLLQAQQTQQTQQAQQVQQLQQQSQQLAQQSENTKAINNCINNLRQIDGAKQQWALENKQTQFAVPTAENLAPYFINQTPPVCPSSGLYTLGNVESVPTCSIPSHALPQ